MDNWSTIRAGPPLFAQVGKRARVCGSWLSFRVRWWGGRR